MNWVTGILVYVIIWWVTIFMVLPWGARPAENPEEGHATSAPAKAMIGRKFLINSIVAAVIWAVVFWLIESQVISIEDIARNLGA
ncbi:DUF1467 family protein [Kiloniella sp. b19]|uniref:DUF1467 family protein n=1 Tax=Kiloniella sp. GXU_MW_B19 TaxID=3141326 RepID=UPI0031DD1B0A